MEPTNYENVHTCETHLHIAVLRITCSLGCEQTDATLLTNNSQHCWMLHVSSVFTPCCMLLNVVACCCARFETGQTFSPVQTDATLLAYNSQHCWELLRPFARSLKLRVIQNLKTDSKQMRRSTEIHWEMVTFYNQ